MELESKEGEVGGEEVGRRESGRREVGREGRMWEGEDVGRGGGI
jgi:hypothetical protein